MRLLLDEHLSPDIARHLRSHGHDVVAVGEREELKGRPDWLHFANASHQRRVIVTYDHGDFRPLVAAALRTGAPTFGIICVPVRIRPDRDAVGRLVRALEALLDTYPDDDAVVRRGSEIWLDDPR